MQRYFLILLVALLAACSKSEVAPPAGVVEAARMAPPAVAALADGAAAGKDVPATEARRYIAYRHQLTLEVAGEALPKVFEATVRQCEALKCQIISASINRIMPYQPASASLSMRIPPEALGAFMDHLDKNATLIQHRRESEDKTDAVIDAEAHIKNLTELRDRLREMLAKPTGSLKDMVEVERELANTQAQLEAVLTTRKLLAKETEMVEVSVDFQAQSTITEAGAFAPVAEAWHRAGRMMMESFAGMISFLAVLLPWLLVGVPLLIVMRKGWRKLRARASI